ncbi:hypothetical protein Q5H91_09420 [Sphingomonas sp. KR1UV-12]|uniref:Uncharacterized protein n=1 Tax=Sphingomonas aurea TaxID=3063994 RepID=A0ABT9EKG0_9SPHN|nr:hypothetical protein [Sphingomonas sp. KR1UV-12]MDP1027431.1 hypothetical protein [Sphingomonas sp. KR1UV-12]
MADFDDAADPELGAACNRLSAFTLPIPSGALIDQASGLTEADLATILRTLYRDRHRLPTEQPEPNDSEPTRRGPWG